ncbi:MAG: hypothetical protein ABIA04_00340 [Pseudomonadota bacterium]
MIKTKNILNYLLCLFLLSQSTYSIDFTKVVNVETGEMFDTKTDEIIIPCEASDYAGEIPIYTEEYSEMKMTNYFPSKTFPDKYTKIEFFFNKSGSLIAQNCYEYTEYTITDKLQELIEDKNQIQNLLHPRPKETSSNNTFNGFVSIEGVLIPTVFKTFINYDNGGSFSTSYIHVQSKKWRTELSKIISRFKDEIGDSKENKTFFIDTIEPFYKYRTESIEAEVCSFSNGVIIARIPFLQLYNSNLNSSIDYQKFAEVFESCNYPN